MTNTVITRTETDVREHLRDLSVYLTWGAMEQIYPIPGASLCAYAKDRPFVNLQHRKIFGLGATVETEPCPTCGKACTYNCGTQQIIAKPGTAKRQRPKRPACNIRSAQSTYDSLVNAGMSTSELSELARIILENGVEMEY